MGLRILLVDKSAASSDSLVPSLERKGYEVSVARTLKQALSRLGSFRPDILFVNVVSFGRSGYKVCSGIRNQTPGTPRILAVDNGCAEVGGEDEDRIKYPCTARALLSRVAKIARTITIHELCVGTFCFDTVTRSVRLSDRVSVLRPKEAALLAYLMQHAGRVLPRLEIIHAVWDPGYVGDTRTLSVHVRWLREKIEENPDNPRLLRTVRGVGYCFDADKDSAPS